jgi:hypothetical protein
VDLIPPYYDTRRIVRILGEDGEPQSVSLDPDQQVARVDIQTAQGVKSIHNPGVGEYDVSITVGPSYNTKRMEAAATFVELAKGAADPATALVMSYLTVRNSDFNGAEDAAKMIKALLPPQVLQAVSPGGPQTIPPQVQAQMQQAQLAMQALQQHNQELITENQQLKAGAQQEAAKIQSEHVTEMKRIGLDAHVEGEKAKLAREKAAAELALKKAIAKAEIEIEDLRLAAEHDRAERELTAETSRAEREVNHKIKMEQSKEDATVAPQFVQALDKITTTLALRRRSSRTRWRWRHTVGQGSRRRSRRRAHRTSDGRRSPRGCRRSSRSDHPDRQLPDRDDAHWLRPRTRRQPAHSAGRHVDL